ncbi:MAG: hypothetical protein R3326_09990 [Gemmatimonadota bacterium]|nr:hypothetical protein [Gemmatimonadota bacterium]
MRTTLLPLVIAFALAPAGARSALAQEVPACDEVEGFHRLDFWVGEWDVHAGDRQVGTNRIEKILDGCAIMEHWTSAGGSEGKSLFYYDVWTDEWKQVWVTARATRVAGLKEKTLIERFDDGGVRFQGRISLPDGEEAIDRTTLTPLPDGTVRQVIEASMDGESWRTNFDAIYRPAGRSDGSGR